VSIAGSAWLIGQRRLRIDLVASAPARDPVRTHRLIAQRQPGPPPLLAGWSGRGPPHVSSAPI
jgi:hypothetical protein